MEYDQNEKDNSSYYSSYINYKNTVDRPQGVNSKLNNIDHNNNNIYNVNDYLLKQKYSNNESLINSNRTIGEKNNVISNNKKLNEFKEIVESSYLNHVLNGNDSFKYQQQLYPEQRNLDTSINKNYERKSSLDMLSLSHRSFSSSLSLYDPQMYNDEFVSNSRQNRIYSLTNEASSDYFSTKPGKIQYMSAYNIYEPEEKKAQIKEEINEMNEQNDKMTLEQKPRLDKIRPEFYRNSSSNTYDSNNSDSSQLSSPIQFKLAAASHDEANLILNNYYNSVNDDKIVDSAKKHQQYQPRLQSPRVKLYKNNEDLIRTDKNPLIKNGSAGYSSSTSRSSSSPRSIKLVKQPHPPVPIKQQKPVSPPSPASSSRSGTNVVTKVRIQQRPDSSTIPQVSPSITTTPRHEARPPSTQKLNEGPNYRKKFIRKSNKPVNKSPMIATELIENRNRQQDLNDTRQSTSEISSINNLNPHNQNINDSYRVNEIEIVSSYNEKSINNVNNEQSRPFRPHSISTPLGQDKESMRNDSLVIPDLLKNCLEEKPMRKIEEYQFYPPNYDIEKKLDDFFTKKSDKKPPQKVFRNGNSESNHEDEDGHNEEDAEDTLNMLSSRESLNNIDIKESENDTRLMTKTQTTNEILKNFNLNINLDDLSGDDDEVANENKKNNKEYEGKNLNYNNEDDDDDNDLMMQPLSSTQRAKQIKPSFIPNLMLDNNDDDKSISVAASLAKSMCKEIDYKQEMENLIINDPINQNQSSTVHNTHNNNNISNNYNSNNRTNQIVNNNHNYNNGTKVHHVPPINNNSKYINKSISLMKQVYLNDNLTQKLNNNKTRFKNKLAK